ncbi:TPA: hypothetical protein ACG3KP_004062, partial [Clostridioides difficile]
FFALCLTLSLILICFRVQASLLKKRSKFPLVRGYYFFFTDSSVLNHDEALCSSVSISNR